MKIRAFVFVVIALFAMSACSNQKKVGSAIDVNALKSKNGVLGKLEQNKNKGSGVLLGQPSATPAAQTQSNSKAAAAAAQQRQQQIEAQKKANAVAFSITGSGYDPYYIRVFTGGEVSVTNRDRIARSVTADQGAFDSGPIQPGATWTYEPKSAGKFNFHDSTRPYVVGTLEVDSQ